MKKNMWVLGFFVGGFYGLILFSGYAQARQFEAGYPTEGKEVVGEVGILNFDTETMVVKAYLDAGKISPQEIEIVIAKGVMIIKNGQEIFLKDLQAGNNISVRYIETTSGQKEGYYIWVK